MGLHPAASYSFPFPQTHTCHLHHPSPLPLTSMVGIASTSNLQLTPFRLASHLNSGERSKCVNCFLKEWLLEVKGSVSVCVFSVEKQHFGNETLISVLFRTKRSIVHDCGHKNHFLSLSFLNPVLKYSSHESIFILKTLLIWWIYLNSSKAWKLKCKKNLHI